MTTLTGRISGTGYLVVGEIVLRNLIYCLGTGEDGRGEGTVLADFSSLAGGDTNAVLHLIDNRTLQVLLYEIDAAKGRAMVKTLGPISDF